MKRKATVTRIKSRVAVAKGQCYRVPRPGKPARHVVVAKVVGPDSDQPKAMLYEITRGGQRKGTLRVVTSRDLEGKPKASVPNLFPHWLQWDCDRGVWDIGPGMELIEEVLVQAA